MIITMTFTARKFIIMSPRATAIPFIIMSLRAPVMLQVYHSATAVFIPHINRSLVTRITVLATLRELSEGACIQLFQNNKYIAWFSSFYYTLTVVALLSNKIANDYMHIDFDI